MYGEQSVIARKCIFTFIKKKNSDVYINIVKRYILEIKELVLDPFIIIKDNA